MAPEEEGGGDVGGMFTITKTGQQGKSKAEVYGELNGVDCSKFPVEFIQDWSLEEVGYNPWIEAGDMYV